MNFFAVADRVDVTIFTQNIFEKKKKTEKLKILVESALNSFLFNLKLQIAFISIY